MGIGAVISAQIVYIKLIYSVYISANFLAIFSTTIRNNRTTHKLFKYDVVVTKLSCLIVFIVICTDNFLEN